MHCCPMCCKKCIHLRLSKIGSMRNECIHYVNLEREFDESLRFASGTSSHRIPEIKRNR